MALPSFSRIVEVIDRLAIVKVQSTVKDDVSSKNAWGKRIAPCALEFKGRLHPSSSCPSMTEYSVAGATATLLSTVLPLALLQLQQQPLLLLFLFEPDVEQKLPPSS